MIIRKFRIDKHQVKEIQTVNSPVPALILDEPRYEKTCLRGVRPAKTQTGLRATEIS